MSIRVPSRLVDSGVEVLLGAWTDTLWDAEQWDRFPAVTRVQRVDDTELEIASAFGGPIYFRVPVGAGVSGVTVDLSGVLPMPRYRHGTTTAEQWAADLAASDVPWAELETSRIVLTVPRSEAAEVTNPVALGDLWVEVLDAMSALEATPIARPRAERIVLDRQISAGFMHSGYPIMAHLVSAADLLGRTGIEAAGSWGAFHELGHNHQWADWVLPGTVESSCNLWSVYVTEEVLGISRDDAHPELDPAARAARIESHLAGGPDFSEWEVWVALESYLQLQEAFGWELYQTLLPAYRALTDEERPGSDAERIDQWVLRASQAAGVDLGPFYVAWGVPVSEGILTQTAELPVWVDDPMNAD